MPGDVVSIGLGVVPLLVAAAMVYGNVRAKTDTDGHGQKRHG